MEPDTLLPNDEQESGLLQTCPRCLYSLHGLPEQHHCPECGLQVDRRWQVFGGRLIPRKAMPSGKIIQAFLLIAMSYPIIVIIMIFAFAPGGLPRLLPIVVAGGVGAIAWVVFRKPRCFVAVGPNGLETFLGRDRFEHYDWQEIGRAQFDLARKSIRIKSADRDILLPTPKFFGLHVGEVDRCVQGINHYPRGGPSAADCPPASPPQ